MFIEEFKENHETEGYIISVKDYMRLHYIPLILLNSGEDP